MVDHMEGESCSTSVSVLSQLRCQQSPLIFKRLQPFLLSNFLIQPTNFLLNSHIAKIPAT